MPLVEGEDILPGPSLRRASLLIVTDQHLPTPLHVSIDAGLLFAASRELAVAKSTEARYRFKCGYQMNRQAIINKLWRLPSNC